MYLLLLAPFSILSLLSHACSFSSLFHRCHTTDHVSMGRYRLRFCWCCARSHASTCQCSLFWQPVHFSLFLSFVCASQTHGGQSVYVTGSFNSWQGKLAMQKNQNEFTLFLNIPPGKYYYKFIVDGEWCASHHYFSVCHPHSYLSARPPYSKTWRYTRVSSNRCVHITVVVLRVHLLTFVSYSHALYLLCILAALSHLCHSHSPLSFPFLSPTHAHVSHTCQP